MATGNRIPGLMAIGNPIPGLTAIGNQIRGLTAIGNQTGDPIPIPDLADGNARRLCQLAKPSSQAMTATVGKKGTVPF